MAAIAVVRARAAKIVREHRADPSRLAAEALRLAATDEQLAFEIFRASSAAVATLTTRQIEGLLKFLHDWNSTDCFGSFISGVAWREGTISDSTILKWATSDTTWTRRAALVSTVPLNQPARGATNARGEAAKTLAVCKRLIDDRDDMVVKAMSWALRVLAVKDAKAVAAFVKEHRGRLAARVIRETNNKLKTGKKNPKKSTADARKMR
jgi:3-methyladenine DNA glycosylase AlkD